MRENANQEDTQSTPNVPLLPIISIIVISPIAVTSGLTIYYLLTRSFTIASNIASVSSSIATILLVVLTGWYTFETRRLVDEERERYEDSKRNEQMKIREALLSELYAMEYYFNIVKEIDPIQEEPYNEFLDIPSTAVYDDVSPKIGLLSKVESDAVNVFYNQLKPILSGQKASAKLKSEQRELPDPVQPTAKKAITTLNERWIEAINVLESNISKEIPDNRRNLVRLQKEEREGNISSFEMNELQEGILEEINERGMAKVNYLSNQLNREEDEIESECLELVQHGFLTEINGVFTPPFGDFQE